MRLDVWSFNLVGDIFRVPRVKAQILDIVNSLTDLLYFLVANDRLDGRISRVQQQLVDGLVGQGPWLLTSSLLLVLQLLLLLNVVLRQMSLKHLKV